MLDLFLCVLGLAILVQRVNHAIGQAANGLAVFHCAADDLVFNVGDIAHIGHLEATDAQPALHHIKRQHRARMSQVTEVIDRHAAYIHADMALLNRNK